MSHLLNSLNTDIFVMLTQVPFLNKPTKSCNVKRQKVIRVGPFFFSVKDWNVYIYISLYISVRSDFSFHDTQIMNNT